VTSARNHKPFLVALDSGARVWLGGQAMTRTRAAHGSVSAHRLRPYLAWRHSTNRRVDTGA
jgi:hypothetical protein